MGGEREAPRGCLSSETQGRCEHRAVCQAGEGRDSDSGRLCTLGKPVKAGAPRSGVRTALQEMSSRPEASSEASGAASVCARAEAGAGSK